MDGKRSRKKAGKAYFTSKTMFNAYKTHTHTHTMKRAKAKKKNKKGKAFNFKNGQIPLKETFTLVTHIYYTTYIKLNKQTKQNNKI